MNLLANITYRALPALRPQHNPYLGQWHGRRPPRFEFLRLVATRWRQAATLLIDWDRAVNEGWPSLRSPAHAAGKRFRRVIQARSLAFGRPAARSS